MPYYADLIPKGLAESVMMSSFVTTPYVNTDLLGPELGVCFQFHCPFVFSFLFFSSLYVCVCGVHIGCISTCVCIWRPKIEAGLCFNHSLPCTSRQALSIDP